MVNFTLLFGFFFFFLSLCHPSTMRYPEEQPDGDFAQHPSFFFICKFIALVPKCMQGMNSIKSLRM
jgi:hypothetical protein